MGQILIEAKKLKKVFGNFVANHDISFTVEPGKIYALAGENGAGKSTLMKMLYGINKIDGGQLFIDGVAVDPDKYSPTIAREKGIGMVFQDFRLVPAFTVLENVFLSTQSTGFYFKKKELREKLIEVAKKYKLNVNPDEEVWRMDLGQRQHVEILKVILNDNTRILIFDEPTSVLAPNEIAAFLDLLVSFKENGFAILLITHKIHEIVQVADVVHILRKGELVNTFYKENGLRDNEIVAAMIGEKVNDNIMEAQSGFKGKDSEKDNKEKEVVLAGNNMTIDDDYGRHIINNSNITLKKGTILGVAGISGNGQRELTEAVYGIRNITSGKLVFNGKSIKDTKVKERLDMGFRILSEDPIRDNVIPDYSVLQHMAISGFKYKKKGFSIDWKDLKHQLESCEDIKDLNVPDGDRKAEKLSGGNIQRMAFARAVISHPKVLIASYPSRGLDIATVKAVHDTLNKLKNEGAAVLFISEDLNELFNMSDELVVLSENSIHGPYTPKEYDSQKIGEIMLKGVSE